MRIAIVVGEASGDLLGAGLVRELRQRYPEAHFEGIGGPLMQQQGFVSLYAMESLSVMGLMEVLGRLPELVKIRSGLVRHLKANPPDVFIGIDAPDFTLGLERKLKSFGIRTLHYVSPQIWAWRQGRVKQIARTVDLMLVLFPFEQDFYTRHGVPVRFVGHPLADLIAEETPPQPSRARLGIDAQERVVALLPGSRMSEVRKLGATFIEAAALVREQLPDTRIVIAAANAATATAMRAELARLGRLPEDTPLFVGQAREVMSAADALLVASGTVTLEAMLINRPMVVAYKMAPLTYRIATRLVKSKYIALPNLLADQPLVPEFVQDQASPAALATALLKYFNDPQSARRQHSAFLAIHRQLRQQADAAAAQAIAALIESVPEPLQPQH